ncbi:MAG TPA: class I SAM-dependent methyltransferase [Cryptosporangiaceae bacterium]|nr:class I SAM-dependent methyltransferase [Cryptosporangiaceae bacterium]
MTERPMDPSVDPFTADIAANAGYLYTTNATLSSRLANRRLTDASVAVGDFAGHRVVDIGCGDGTYTFDLFEATGPSGITGLDPAEHAVRVAHRKVGDRPITFVVGSALDLPYPGDSFDVAYLRGVLHHMTRPVEALREALRVATSVVVVEPNGYNPVLKVLERCSTYHIEHGEQSYPPRRLDRWVRDLGGTVERREFAGLVPFFCPDWMARLIKRIEPLVERLPGVRHIGCAVYVFTATNLPRVAQDAPAGPSGPAR